jgi:hypothetical protein
VNEFIRPAIQRDYALEAFIKGLYVATGPRCTLEKFYGYFVGFDKARAAQLEALQKLATDAINCQSPIYIMSSNASLGSDDLDT